MRFFKHIKTIPNTINLFIDITTKCNLKCSYCFARKTKEWDKIQSIEKLKLVSNTLRFSEYNFNIILFGGEALLHPDIKKIVELFNNNKKVLNTVLLTNGTYNGDYGLYVEYVFTLHDLSDKEFLIFKDNIRKTNKSIINLMLKNNIRFKNQYHDLLNEFGKDKIEISQIYDDNTIVNDITDEFDFIEYNKDYLYNGKSYTYQEYIKIHKNIIPKDIGICYVQELNIDIDGNISNDCNNISDNIFDNPLFFKSYNNKYNCQRDFCKDCTGTIRTTKELDVK